MAKLPQKDTIYIDIDDEITAIIDKLKSSKHKIVALVLPKRATVFQSVVNMKLLKRSAEEAKKHLVLITSEAALMPLAGAVGVHVAKSLLSKPEIPAAPGESSGSDLPENDDAALDKTAPVGKLAGLPDKEDESIQVDNSKEDTAAAASAAAVKPKDKKNKLKIPNFDKFRLKLIIGVAALVLLIVGWYFAFNVFPRATVILRADTSDVQLEEQFTADTNATELDAEEGIIPAISKEFKKTATEKVPASGEEDRGKKATGTITLTNCSSTTGSLRVPSGTGISTGNLTYITNKSVTLPESEFNFDDDCTTDEVEVSVTAQKGGEQYNLSSGKSFTVAGYSKVEATNESSLSGGTTKIVKIVQQSDIDGAKQKILDSGNESAPDELANNLRDEGFYPLEDTLTAGEPEVMSSPKVGSDGNEVTVTVNVTYTMLGVEQEELKKFVEEKAKGKIDQKTQVIRDNGLDEAVIRKQGGDVANGQIQLSLKTTVKAGPEFNDDAVKEQIAGKKRGEIQSELEKLPGVEEVEVVYSPFYVQTTPKDPNKINIELEDNKSEDE